MAYAITIEGRLYGYGETESSAYRDYTHQTAGATRQMQQAMWRRAHVSPLSDDEASEVAEMIAAPAIRWD